MAVRIRHPPGYLLCIDPTRSGEPPEQLLGFDWPGTLVLDGWSVYDRFHSLSSTMPAALAAPQSANAGNGDRRRGALAAEKALRPAVVNCNWGGTSTRNGPKAHSMLMSVLRTCRQRSHDAFAFLLETLCRPQPQLIPA